MIDGRTAIQAIIVRDMGLDYSFHAARYFTHAFSDLEAFTAFTKVDPNHAFHHLMLSSLSQIRQCFGFPKHSGPCCSATAGRVQA